LKAQSAVGMDCRETMGLLCTVCHLLHFIILCSGGYLPWVGYA